MQWCKLTESFDDIPTTRKILKLTYHVGHCVVMWLNIHILQSHDLTICLVIKTNIKLNVRQKHTAWSNVTTNDSYCSIKKINLEKYVWLNLSFLAPGYPTCIRMRASLRIPFLVSKKKYWYKMNAFIFFLKIMLDKPLEIIKN